LVNGDTRQASASLEKAYTAKSSEAGKSEWRKEDWLDLVKWPLVTHLAEINKNIGTAATSTLSTLLLNHHTS